MHSVKLLRLPGFQSYESVCRLQERLVSQKMAQRSSTPDFLLFLQHEPVITLGRRSHSLEPSTTIPIFKSKRGGQTTYHGPGQVVVYPILDLLRYKQSLQWYVDSLAAAMKGAVKDSFGLNSFYQSCPDKIGLWLSEREKVGFIGIQAQRWIVSHGFSINVTKESTHGFYGIDPCGLGPDVKIASCAEKSNIFSNDNLAVETTFNSVVESFSDVFKCKIEAKDFI